MSHGRFSNIRSKDAYVLRFMPLHVFSGRAASLFFLIVATGLMLVSVTRPQAIDGLRMMISDAASPVLSTASKPFLATAEFVGGVSGISELRAENAQLKAENERLRGWYQKALMLQSENQSLQDLLNLKVAGDPRFITTRVIADSGNAYVDSILVAAGSKDRVQEGQAVISGEGMIGRVISVGQNSARVLLITDYNSRIPVLIEGSRQKAVLAGNNDPYPTLKYLPPDGEIEEGMRIVTSGHGGLFPRGLPIGRIIKRTDGHYAVQPFSDMSRISYVRVVDAPTDPNLRRGILDTDNAF